MAEIIGYRKLSGDEIAQINHVKDAGAEIERMCEILAAGAPDLDERALAIAKTNFQTAFMWLNRAIAKPTTFA